MPVTQAQVTAATTADQRDALRLQLYFDGEQRANAQAEAGAVRHGELLGAMRRQATAAEAILALQQKMEAALPTPGQERFIELFRMCLDARKQSLTTSSSDSVLADNVRDALFMATSVWPTYKAELDARA